MKREVLKSLALKAKNRMIHKNGGSLADNEGLNIKIIASDDEKFIDKVKALIEDGDDIVNPIGKLMDDDVLLTLDANGRERYLLETVEKYHRAIKLIQKQRRVSEVEASA